MTVLLGIAGSFLAGIVGQPIGWYKAGEGASVIVAIILLVIYGKIKGRTSS